MGIELLPPFLHEHYEIHEWKHACAILKQDFPSEWQDVAATLTAFRLKKSWLTQGGGSKSGVSHAIDQMLYVRGWEEKDFCTQLVVDDAVIDSPTHKVDCYKNRIALEIEWNNQGSFL